MFGQGNPAPRPGASLQQLQPVAPQPFQLGGHDGPGPGRPVMQHLSRPSGPQIYQNVPNPPNPQSGAPNLGMYVHGSQHHIGSSQGPYYPDGQHNSQQHPMFGVQNMYHVSPPGSRLPPHPPLPRASRGFHISESLIPPPPPPPSEDIMHRGVCQPAHPAGQHGVPCIQPPQQPLLASVLHRITQSEPSSLAKENDLRLVFANLPPPPSLHSCASPVPPPCPPSGVPISDGKELTSDVFHAAFGSSSALPSSGGCPATVKANDVGDTNELTLAPHNNDSSVIVDGLHNESETWVSVVNSSLGVTNKSEILRPDAGSSSQRISSTSGGLCSTSDSDMDMEDAILNLVEDLETNDLGKNQNNENRVQAENLDAKHRLHGQIPTPASFTGLPSEGVICGHLLGHSSTLKPPIKLLQSSASDDSTEKPCNHNVEDIPHAQPANGESTVLKKVGEPNLVSDGGPNNHSAVHVESNPVPLEHSLMQKKVTDFRKETEVDLNNCSVTYASVSQPAEVAKKDGGKVYLCEAKGGLKLDDMNSKHGKSHTEDSTAPLQLRVDEFGRLAKNVSSDSDSDDIHYSRIRGSRGRSRSISPFGRRKKTPVRKRSNRNRSRSRSPLRRRSRSRSPVYRRPTESISDRRRRDKSQTSICFRFRDGKCHRGSACRFLHHESDRSRSSNLCKRKSLAEAASGDKGYTFQEKSKESLGEKGSHRGEKDESHWARQLNSTKGIHPDSGGVSDVVDKNDVGQGIAVFDHAELDQDDRTMVSYSYKKEDVGGETAHVVEASMPQVAQGQNATNLPGDNKYQKSAQSWHPYDANGLSSHVLSSTSLSSMEKLEANRSAPVPQYANPQPQKSNISHVSLPVLHQSLGTPPPLKTSDLGKDSMSPPSLSYATMDLRIQPVIAENPSSQVPSSVTGMPFSQATTGHCMPQLHSNLSSMQTSTGSPFISGGGPSYNHFSLHNQPQHNPQPVPLWTPFPPPTPQASIYADTINASISASGNTIPCHFEQNQMLKKPDVVPQSISGPYSGQMHFSSQYGGNHHYNYHPSVEAHRPPFALSMLRPNSLFTVNSYPQKTEDLHPERNHQASSQVVIPSTFHIQQSTSFIRPPATGTLSWSETVCHKSSQSDTILNNTSLNDPRRSMTSDSRVLGLPGKIESSSLLTSSANLGASGILEFENSRTSAHCNMHASASDRSLTSMFSQPQMVGAQGVETNVLREKNPSCISIRNTEQSFPESGGGQYDPLLDSLENSSNSLVNSERVKKKHSTNDSDNMLRDNVSCKPLDVEETNWKNESGAIASLTSSDNEEFGETAETEVGPLENESISNLVDVPNRDSEVAISETYRDKKSKDTRSMKLFKSAIANYVKDVLKPSWRQGNMSKEAFKTIVKKTVEKVSGAMKGHRYPKSQAKINHYIDSSERKLRKLVMGYVDKYVKV